MHHYAHRRRWTGRVAAVALALSAIALLRAPADGQPNDDDTIRNAPYPADELHRAIFYTDFNAWPKTLDPGVSYSSDEAEILGLIVETPLEYHYLRRPYELTPRLVRRVPEPLHVLLYPENADRPEDLPSDATAFELDEMHVAFAVPETTGVNAADYLRASNAFRDLCREYAEGVAEQELGQLEAALEVLNRGRNAARESTAIADVRNAVQAITRLQRGLVEWSDACGYCPPDEALYTVPIELAQRFTRWQLKIKNEPVKREADRAAIDIADANMDTAEIFFRPNLPEMLRQCVGYRYVVDLEVLPGILYQPHPCFARDSDNRFVYHAGWETDIPRYRALARPLCMTPDMNDRRRAQMTREISRNGLWSPDVLEDIEYPTELRGLQQGTRELTAADFVFAIKRWAVESPAHSIIGPMLDGYDEYAQAVRADWRAEWDARARLLPNVDSEDWPWCPMRHDFDCAPLAGVRTLDESRFRLSLTLPYRQILYWLSMPFFAPVPWEAVSFYAQPAFGTSYVAMSTAPVGTSAFMMTQFDEERIMMERNPNYNRRGPNDGTSPPAVVDRNGNGNLDAGERAWDDLNGNGKYDPLDETGRMFEGAYFEDRNLNGRHDDGEVWYETPASHRNIYPLDGDSSDEEGGLLRDAGRRLPLIDGYVLSYEGETLPRWERFLDGWHDRSVVLAGTFDETIEFDTNGVPQLSEAMAARGIELTKMIVMSNRYWAFNMEDPVVGGYTDSARKLRQAISIAFDIEDWIDQFLNGRGMAAHNMTPPGIAGGPSVVRIDGPVFANADDINPVVYDAIPVRIGGAVVGYRPERKSIEIAKQLLAEAGWPDGKDANGQRLEISFHNSWTSDGARSQLLWVKEQFAKLGIFLRLSITDYAEFQRKVDNGEHQFIFWGWNADYPDPENFMFLLYGPNNASPSARHRDRGGPNSSNYDSPEYNALFKRLETMPNGPERLELIREATRIAREDCPWIWGYYAESWSLSHQWCGNNKMNLMTTSRSTFRSVDVDARHRYRKQHASR